MKLSEPYEDGGKWYRNVIDPVSGEDVRPVGLELRARPESWSECGGHGGTVWAQGCEYRIPSKPPETDPYHGIMLPEPPAGYRLAKWGEELTTGSRWFDSWTKGWTVFDRFNRPFSTDKPETAIFAIPLDQPASQPPKSWQFRHEPWVPKQPETLADVVEGVPVVCHTNGSSDLMIRLRISKWAFLVNHERTGFAQQGYATNYHFVRYLDPLPQKQLSLDDVPNGRVILSHGSQFWLAGGAWYQLLKDGCIRMSDPESASMWTTTDYVAEFR